MRSSIIYKAIENGDLEKVKKYIEDINLSKYKSEDDVYNIESNSKFNDEFFEWALDQEKYDIVEYFIDIGRFNKWDVRDLIDDLLAKDDLEMFKRFVVGKLDFSYKDVLERVPESSFKIYTYLLSRLR